MSSVEPDFVYFAFLGFNARTSMLVGISPEVAQTIVQLAIDLTGVQTRSNLQAGFQPALALLNGAARVRLS